MTPAVRAAEAAGVEFTLHRYDHDPKADSFGLEAAEKLGVPPERVFKTLVAKVDGKQLVMAILPVADRLDLKKLAAAAGGKKAELAEPAAAERATGYVVGGISPLGGRKRLPTLLDASVARWETVLVSAGQRGLQIELAPQDLTRLTEATAAELATRS
jgi:Cys-tRNA(Pro)/Cys-tRNA(Cys) deacylase